MNEQMITEVYNNIIKDTGIHTAKDKGTYLVGTMTLPLFNKGIAEFSDPADIPPEQGEEGLRLVREFAGHFQRHYQEVLKNDGKTTLHSDDVFPIEETVHDIDRVTDTFIQQFPEVEGLSFCATPVLAAALFGEDESEGFHEQNKLKGACVWVLKWNPEGMTWPYAWSVNLYDYITDQMGRHH